MVEGYEPRGMVLFVICSRAKEFSRVSEEVPVCSWVGTLTAEVNMRPHVLLVGFVLLCAASAAAQFVAPGGAVPVVANLPGLAGTFWQSDVNIVNVSGRDTTITLVLVPEIVGGEPAFPTEVVRNIFLAADAQMTLTNIVQGRFGKINTKGGLQVFSGDGAALLISSRTHTAGSDGGTYGQDVSGVLVADQAWAGGLEHDSLYRTNIGIFWPFDEAIEYTVRVFDVAGTQNASGTISFERSGLQQFSLSDIGVSFLLDGYVEITCSDTNAVWYAYASIVDQTTGDAVYRPGRSFQSSVTPGISGEVAAQ